jgi:CO dehydrogenase maturation factor
MSPQIMAFTGKGGVGKTILSALTGKVFARQGKNVLFVDADPARGLEGSLGVVHSRTIGQAREKIIRAASRKKAAGKESDLHNIIDYLMLEALYEPPDFSLLVMGRTDTIGCYCPLNELLRGTIAAISSQYDVIIIDAEAGLEQVNRKVVETVHYPVIVCDNSLRSVRTALMIDEIITGISGMRPVKTSISSLSGLACLGMFFIIRYLIIGKYKNMKGVPKGPTEGIVTV